MLLLLGFLLWEHCYLCESKQDACARKGYNFENGNLTWGTHDNPLEHDFERFGFSGCEKSFFLHRPLVSWLHKSSQIKVSRVFFRTMSLTFILLWGDQLTKVATSWVSLMLITDMGFAPNHGLRNWMRLFCIVFVRSSNLIYPLAIKDGNGKPTISRIDRWFSRNCPWKSPFRSEISQLATFDHTGR